MVQVLLPARLLQEAAACAALGAALGAARAFLPVRAGRLLCRTCCFWCGAAGVPALRRRVQQSGRAAVVHGSYGLAAALCVAGVLGIPLRALGRGIRAVLCLPGRILHRFAVQPLCRRRAAAKIARKLRRNAERTAKKSKKNLPNQRALLYNSNVSK